jgi:hypothetical protein
MSSFCSKFSISCRTAELSETAQLVEMMQLAKYTGSKYNSTEDIPLILSIVAISAKVRMLHSFSWSKSISGLITTENGWIAFIACPIQSVSFKVRL